MVCLCTWKSRSRPDLCLARSRYHVVQQDKSQEMQERTVNRLQHGIVRDALLREVVKYVARELDA